MEIEERSKKKKSYWYWIIPLLLFFVFAAIVLETERFQSGFIKARSFVEGIKDSSEKSNDEILKKVFLIQNNIISLEKKLQTLSPSKPYIVISATENRFSLRKANSDTIRTGLCSTGKDNIMIQGNKKWVFKTPRGVFTIQNKLRGPVWTKPDWAFIEEGLPVPKVGSPDRVDPYTLGDYALGLGKGYYIHGTLYQRRIGLSETHGCVRIGDADLEVIYNTLRAGSLVFIY
jgi:hypothetical protein